MITIYTDGACSAGAGGWACEIDGQLYSGSYDWVTNNMMEMAAVFHALDEVSANSRVKIITDSKLVIGWLTQGWKCETNPKVRDIRDAIWATKFSTDIEWQFELVKGHSVTAGNNRVDREAQLQSRQAFSERNKKCP